ncbi:calcium-binding protein [Candidatus Uhrbacteria bacterium]|nr:calcium-binding protein [Candidatus Uhrbacteria bacterium]
MPQDGVVTLPFAQDSDEDGLSDKEETSYGTDPESIDTDKDGFSDYNELNSGYDPLRPKVRYYPK